MAICSEKTTYPKTSRIWRRIDKWKTKNFAKLMLITSASPNQYLTAIFTPFHQLHSIFERSNLEVNKSNFANRKLQVLMNTIAKYVQKVRQFY